MKVNVFQSFLSLLQEQQTAFTVFGICSATPLAPKGMVAAQLEDDQEGSLLWVL